MKRQGHRLIGAAHCAALFLFVVIAASGGASPGHAAMRQDKLILITAAGERTIETEVAVTPEDMALGLMFRVDLPEDHGMLFPSEAPREASMWMRNTYISLDMVFIRADGVVHRIEARTEPMSERIIPSNGPVLAVLELAAGAAERIGLKPGDHVRHPLFKAPAQ